MNIFDRFRKNGKDRPAHEVPDTSTVMGTAGNYSDPRVFIRNLAYDALLGEAADEVLYDIFDMPMVSPEGRESLQRDSEKRLSKIIAALPVIDPAVDTVLRVVAEMNPKSADISPEVKEKAIAYESDVARRCVLAALSCLVDLGLVESHLPEAKMTLIKFEDTE